MEKKHIDDLIGKTINHKKYGLCTVEKVIDVKANKASCLILENNETKVFVISTQFFTDLDEIDDDNVVKPKPLKPKREYRKPDLQKYRSNPLVKEIDRKEMRYYKFLERNMGQDDDDDDDDRNEDMD